MTLKGCELGTWERTLTVLVADVVGGAAAAASQIGRRQKVTMWRLARARYDHQKDPLWNSAQRKRKKSKEKKLKHQGQDCSTEEARGKWKRGSMR
jgi:hypothetical protein